MKAPVLNQTFVHACKHTSKNLVYTDYIWASNRLIQLKFSKIIRFKTKIKAQVSNKNYVHVCKHTSQNLA